MAKTIKQNVEDAGEYKDLISDIYQLHRDIKKELGDASNVYSEHLDQSKNLINVIKEKRKFQKIEISDLQKIKSQQEIGLIIVKKQKEYYDKVTEAARGQIQPLIDIGDKVKKIGNTIMGFILNPWVLIGAALVGIFALYKKIEQSGENFRQQTGITGDNFDRIRKVAEQTSVNFAKFGVDAEKSFEIVKALSDEFGSTEKISNELAGTVATMNVALGMSADAAAKVAANFMSILGSSDKSAENMIKITASLAKQAKVAPASIISDISDNSEAIAKWTKSSGDNISRAAVMARTWGINLATVANIAESLLDFESSIENEMNAMVLTGRTINLERARALALEGRLDELQKEIANNLINEREWNRLNMIERQAYAKSIGISVAEMGKMVSRQKDLKDLTEGTIGPALALQKGLSLADVLEAEKVLSPLTELGNTLIRLSSILIRILHPAFALVNLALSGVTWLLDNLTGNKIIDGLLTLAVSIGAVTLAVVLLRFAVGKLKSGVGGLFDKFNLFKKITAGPDIMDKRGIFSKIFGKIGWTEIAKGALMMAVVAGSLIILAFAIKQFADIEWKQLGMAGAAILGLIGAVTLLGLLMSSPIGVFLWAGVGVFAALGASLLLVSTSLILFGKGLEAIKSGLKGFADNLSEIAAAASGLILAVGAIYALSGALASLSMVLAASSIAGFFGLSGSGMIDKLIELSNNADNLKLAAESIQTIVTGGIGAEIAPTAIGAIAAGGIPNVIVSPPTAGDEESTIVADKIDELILLLKSGVGLNLTPAGGTKLGEIIAKNARR